MSSTEDHIARGFIIVYSIYFFIMNGNPPLLATLATNNHYKLIIIMESPIYLV